MKPIRGILLGGMAAWAVLFPGRTDALTRVPFQGTVDVDRKNAAVEFSLRGKRAVSIAIQQEKGTAFHLTAELTDYKTPFFVISSVLEGRLEVRDDASSRLPEMAGWIRSQYTLVDHKPAGDFTADFAIKEDKFIVNSFLSDQLKGKGSFQITAPHAVDVELGVSDVDVNELLKAVMEKDPGVSFGPFEGTIRISGEEDRLTLKGKIATFRGTLMGMDYENMLLNFEGVYPFLSVENSTIVRPDGSIFNISGTLDLSDLKDFESQVRHFINKPMVEQSGEDLEWTLKRLRDKGRKGTSEVKYLLRKENERDPLTDDYGGVFSLEQQFEF